MDFFSSSKQTDQKSMGNDSNLSEDSGTSVDRENSPKTVTPTTVTKVLEAEEIESGDEEISDDDIANESENSNSGADSDSENSGTDNDSKNSMNSSQSSEDRFYKLDLSQSVYEQSDNDWPIREALIFRLV